MRVIYGATSLFLLVTVCSGQNVNSTSNISTGYNFSSYRATNPFLVIVGVCAIAVIAAFVLLCGTTAWNDIRRRRSRLGESAGAQQQPGHSVSAENAVQPLRPEPFIPVVVVSPNNMVDIARRVSDGDKKSLQSPFGQDQGQSTAPSFSRGRVLPLWLESVLQRQRSTASVDDVDMQGGDVSASGKSHPLRRNGSMAKSFRHLGSDCLGSPSRDSSADAAPDGQDSSSQAPSTMRQEESKEEQDSNKNAKT